MSQARVTVVIPAYQAAGMITRPLISALRQTRVPDEIIVIDDGSKDELAAALRPFEGNITVFHKPNGGTASARNLAIDRAQGDFIAFLDADDYWEPKKLELQLAVFEKHPELGIVGSRWFEEPPGEQRYQSPTQEPRFYNQVLQTSGRTAFDVAMCMWTSTLLLRRQTISEDRFVSGLEPAEDRDFWMRLVPANKVWILPDLLATCVLEPNSLTRSNVDRDCGNMLRVLHRHSDLLGERGMKEQEEIVYIRWAGNHLSRGNAAAAVPPAWKRVKMNPISAQAWWALSKSLTLSKFRS